MIKYIVKLKDKYNDELHLTTINKCFCGSIKDISGDRIYFRLHGSNALVIIPHSWIEYLAPSKILWEQGYKYENNL